MRAFKAPVITFEIGLFMAAFCGFVVAASDRIEFNRKKAEQTRKFNAGLGRW